MSKATPIIAVVHEDGQPVLCRYHVNAILWEVVEGPYQGIRGCDACLHEEIGALQRDLTRFVCLETDQRFSPGEEISGLPLFGLGQVVVTPGALEVLSRAGQTPEEFFRRHVSGDWGDLNEHDLQANKRALQEALRLFSEYQTNKGERIWIITEWERSVTTILLPEEY